MYRKLVWLLFVLDGLAVIPSVWADAQIAAIGSSGALFWGFHSVRWN